MTTAIIGDLHASDVKPSSRIDDYSMVCIDKLESILKIHDYIIILGDVFNSSSVSTEYCNKLIKRLKPYKGRIHAILGNHDASYRTTNLDKTDIGTLFNAEILELHMDSFSLEGISYDVASVVPSLVLPNKKSNILLGHFYISNNRAPKESLSVQDLSIYDYVFLGHDHSPYPNIVTDRTSIFRLGSFMRTDAQPYNLTRDIICYAVINKGNVSIEQIKVTPAREVFTPESFNDIGKETRVLCDLSNLDSLISNFRKRNPSEVISTSSILSEIETPEPCIEYLKMVHEFVGIRF